jgi:3-methyladenine DNA glycosylase AlkD
MAGMAKRKSAARATTAQAAKRAAKLVDAATVVAWLEKHANQRVRDGMACYGIPSDNAFGIAVGELRKYAKQVGRNHELAADLWATGFYEARMLAAYVDVPAEVTPAQMDRWAKDFDNWALCDTVCFHLFDRSPHAWKKIAPWARRRDEFVRRAAFALLASLTVHDKEASDDQFAAGLELIERAAEDDRNFVKKSVNWALRSIGKRSLPLHGVSVALAERLAASSNPTARWNGKDALRELRGPSVLKRLSAKGKRTR